MNPVSGHPPLVTCTGRPSVLVVGFLAGEDVRYHCAGVDVAVLYLFVPFAVGHGEPSYTFVVTDCFVVVAIDSKQTPDRGRNICLCMHPVHVIIELLSIYFLTVATIGYINVGCNDISVFRYLISFQVNAITKNV